MEIDVSKPLKRTLKYVLDGVCYEYLLDYENITIFVLEVEDNLTNSMVVDLIPGILH